MSAFNALVAEAEPDRRALLVAWLNTGKDIRLVGEGGTFLEACHTNGENARVDLIVANMDQCDMASMRTWTLVKATYPLARVLAITAGRREWCLEAILLASFTAIRSDELQRDLFLEMANQALVHGIPPSNWVLGRLKPLLGSVPEVTVVKLGDLSVDLVRGRVHIGPIPMALTDLEYAVLSYLAQNSNRPVGSQELLERVWQVHPGQGGTRDQVKSLIRRVRRKLAQAGNGRWIIRNVRGEGYQLHGEVSPQEIVGSLSASRERVAPE